ncbi:EF-hand domain-containing protein [Agrobacterium deltaense]|uniref:EF-hand domain-containing protein n=1 Tax=Agrobacterium deltaense TaxID=1183412 RepID=UPI0009B94F75|nr:EF-hand domain-containing protein [Agrobacterium deltaense]MBS0256933.1 EF-hand domain-containing protein [Pseudomonadota bacterium]
MTMTTRKIALSALGAALLIGTAATASFAAPPAPGKGHGERMPIRQEAAFVHLLKVADSNKDGKISKEEFAARQDALFTEIDKDKDGSITPKEMREYRQAKMEAFRAANPRPEREDAKAEDGKGPEGKRAERHAEREHGGRFGHKGWGKHGGKGAGFALIRWADTDENGQVSKAEFTAAGEKMFERLDKNKDGVISIDDMPDRPFL